MNKDAEKARKDKEEPDTVVSLVKLFAYVFLQAGALAAGVFTILAWINSQDAKAQADAANSLSQDANVQARGANVLAFAALCGNSPSQPYISSLCEVASPAANRYLSSMASSMFGVSITADPSATPTATITSSMTRSTSTSAAGITSIRSSTSTRSSTAYATATNPTYASPGGVHGVHLTTATKIAIGAGVGIGLPTLIIGIAGLWLIRRKRL